MLAFVVTVPLTDAELAADHLFQSLGVAAVEQRDGDVAGCVELWTDVGIERRSIADAAASLRPEWAWRAVTLKETVTTSWRRFAAPTWVTDDVVIVPSWVADETETGAALAISIDPGAAFGMGDHPTTQLTLRSMLEVFAVAAAPSVRVLDVGCGSGVLAIAAALAGCPSVVAIDISTAAVEATTVNALTNGVAGRISASTTPIVEIDGTFDIVLANVLAPALIGMAADLRRVLAPHGTLVVSGLRADRHDHVLAALVPLVAVRSLNMDGWTAVTLRTSHAPAR